MAGTGSSTFSAAVAALATFLLLLVAVVVVPRSCQAADPAPLQDYCVADTAAKTWVNGLPCINPSTVTPTHFQTSALSKAPNTSANALGFNCFFASAASGLPGLNTLGATLSRCDFAGNSVTPPHVHPRATEIVFVAGGSLDWGFVDTSNRLFGGRANTGDVFVVPQGLIHYVLNNASTPALAVVTFTSQNPGVSLVPSASFASEPAIPSALLQRTFRLDAATVAAIRRALGGS